MSDLFAPAALTVSELNSLAKRLLEDNLFGIWVSGEVSNLTRAASGHYYFSLKDSKAQVRCAMFKGTASKVGTALKEGDQIELTGKISIYEARGEYQITVNDVRMKGLGQLYEAYERLKTKLQAEGVFNSERKQPVPLHPRSIGIVTSLAAAALRDVVSTLKRRAPDIPIIIYPTPVQGAGSELQIAKAIHTAAARQEVDVLIVCRGGGSIEDLWAFNEEPVVRAIEACPIPVVSGVGHETDFTLADFVADVRAPTPTAAAELVSPNRAELIQKVNVGKRALHSALQQRYYDASQKLDWLARNMRHPQQKLGEQGQYITTLHTRLRAGMQTHFRFHSQRAAQQNQRLQHLRPDTAQAARQLNTLKTLLTQNWQALWNQRCHRFEKQAELLQAVSPQHILARGFSVVKNSRGQVIRDAATLKQGQKLHIVFAEGEADVRVTSEHLQPDLFDFS